MARLTKYNYELCKTICERVSLGEHIKTVLDSDPSYPSFQTWCNWKREHTELFDMYYSIPKMAMYKEREERKGLYNINGVFNRGLYDRTRRSTNIQINIKQRVSGLIRDSFTRRKSYSIINVVKKNLTTEEILGCSIPDFVSHIESQFKVGMSFDNRKDWHLDHIIPISYAKTEEEIIKLNHYTNYQPLWASENLAKGNKYIG